MKRHEESFRACPGRIRNKQRQQISVPVTDVAIGSKPRPEVQALPPREGHHRDRLFVINLEAAQNSLDFHQTATTELRPSLSRRSSTSKTDQKGSEKKNIKRSNRLPRNRVDTSMDSRAKPPGKTQHRKQLSSRQPRANFSTADVIKEIRSNEVYVQCTCCSKRRTL